MNRITRDLFENFSCLENVNLTIPGPDQKTDHEVKRSWKERLFTLPWRPFKKTRHYVSIRETRLPDPQYYIMGRNIIAHPATMQRLRNELKKMDVED